MKIRSDLVGVVTTFDTEGLPITLSAGDDVPKGAEVGDHVTEDAPARRGRPAKPDSE